jgi:hypothetical protein
MNELVFEEVPEYTGDPQEIIKTRLTPLALQRMEEMLESPDAKVVDRAVERIGKWDKRLQPEAVPAAQVAVLNFDPEHLARALGGVGEMLGGVQKKGLRGEPTTAVDSERLEGGD